LKFRVRLGAALASQIVVAAHKRRVVASIRLASQAACFSSAAFCRAQVKRIEAAYLIDAVI
jgi:hypothetical protein